MEGLLPGKYESVQACRIAYGRIIDLTEAGIPRVFQIGEEAHLYLVGQSQQFRSAFDAALASLQANVGEGFMYFPKCMEVTVCVSSFCGF